MPFTPIAIALGSNLGDRRAHLDWAVARLSEHLRNLNASTVIETDPVGVEDEQPPYFNAVVVGDTELEPRKLMQLLLTIEEERGRRRPALRAARTLDLDLILYGDRVIDEPGLQVPHPRFRDRAFVLGPLAEVAPEMIDPISGQRVEDLLAQLR